jgi:threonine dehydratase
MAIDDPSSLTLAHIVQARERLHGKINSTPVMRSDTVDARAAKLRGIPAYVVMPNNSPKAKEASVRRYGGVITSCEPTLKARESVAREVMERTRAMFIHPYDDLRVMAGQGTIALELVEEVANLDLILWSVGGGGLVSGIATACKALDPKIKVVVSSRRERMMRTAQ